MATSQGRGLTTLNKNAASDDVVFPFFAIKADLDAGDVYSGPLLIWSGYGDLVINSETYLGVGQLISIGGLEETLDLRATGFSVNLNGIDTNALNIALNANYQNRDITIYMGFNDSTGTLIDTPFILGRGRMDTMTIEEGAEFSTIVIQCENRLIDFERPRRRLYTDEDQRRDHPTDTGFSFVKVIQDLKITWGQG